MSALTFEPLRTMPNCWYAKQTDGTLIGVVDFHHKPFGAWIIYEDAITALTKGATLTRLRRRPDTPEIAMQQLAAAWGKRFGHAV